jgi:hypothetical protein
MTNHSVRLFWLHVDKDGPKAVHVRTRCWVWSGSRVQGYGRLRVGRVVLYAHRLSWLIEHGSWPGTMRVLHRCDVRACIRPSHLFLGTPQDNMDDARSKDRVSRGEARPQAKLTNETAGQMRMMGDAGFRVAFLSRWFGVAYSTARAVVSGEAWRRC